LFRYVMAQQQTERLWLDEMVKALETTQGDAADDMATAKRLLQSLFDDYLNI
jgi:hypothetical protein